MYFHRNPAGGPNTAVVTIKVILEWGSLIIVCMTVTMTVASVLLSVERLANGREGSCCSVVAKGQFRRVIVMYSFIVCKQGGRGGTSESGNVILKRLS